MKKFFAVTALIICLLSATASAGNNVVATYIVVNCRESITLRAAPSVYAAELAQIPLGQAVGFIERAGNGFYKINFDGLVGFALAEYLSPQKSARTATVVNCRESITLRENPSVTAYELMQIPLGARVRFLGGETNEFYQVEYRGVVGYALKVYLRLE